MVTDNLKPARRPWGSYALVLLWAAIGTSALLMLAKSVQHSSDFGRLQPWILLLNVIGVIGLTVLISRKIWQLVRDFRNNVPGSRLTARTVSTFGALVVAPLLIVYLFSLDFLNRGIDSWFRVEVKQGLNDALLLSRAAIDVRMREYGVTHGALRRGAGLHAARTVGSPSQRRTDRYRCRRDRAVRFGPARDRLQQRQRHRGRAHAAAVGGAAPGEPAPSLRGHRSPGRRPVPDPGGSAAVRKQ